MFWFNSNSLFSPAVQFIWLAASGHFIYRIVGESADWRESWQPHPTDTETISLIQKVTEGECPIGVLADWLEEKDVIGWARLLRTCDTLGFETYHDAYMSREKQRQ